MNRITFKFVLTFLIFAFIIIFISGQSIAYERELKELSANIISKIDQSGKKSIAVTDFTGLQGEITELGRFIAEELSIELMNNVKKFEIIDRNHLKSILKEHKFAMSGLVDPKTIKEVGRIAGVDAIITGSVIPFGDNIKVTCKVIATDTARVISAGKINIAKTKAIDELLAKEIGDGSLSKSQDNIQGKPDTLKKQQSNEPKNAVTYSDVTISLSGCEMDYIAIARRTNISCKIKIMNNGRNKVFMTAFRSGRGALDNFGNELGYGNLWFRGAQQMEIKSGMSAEGIYKFYGTSPNTTILKLLRIAIQTDAKDIFELEFKDVAVNKTE